MEAADELHLLTDRREGAGRKWDRAVLLAFPVVDGQEHGIEVEALNPEVHALREAQAAPVEEQSRQPVGRLRGEKI